MYLYQMSDMCRKSKKNENVGDRDRISELPDEILTHILSYVRTKTSVATSVLSKRWNRVWISVPSLDFSGYSPKYNRPVEKVHFENFVDRVLSLNTVQSVRKIHIKVYENFELSRVDAWINSVLMRDAETLELCLPRSIPDEDDADLPPKIYSLPDSFYNKNRLVTLYLNDVDLKVPTSVNFPCLKDIQLESVQFLDDDSMDNLMLGSPALKSLLTQGMSLYLHSPTLHDLHVRNPSGLRSQSGIIYNVVINAPNLRYLTLDDTDVDVIYEIIDVTSLMTAHLNLGHSASINYPTYNSRLELVRRISHVKQLTITGFLINSLRRISIEDLPIFSRLSYLKLECLRENWHFLHRLLHCMPNLVTLEIERDDVCPRCKWHEPYRVAHCFLSTIEIVKIDYIDGLCNKDLRMLRYILKNAMVLKMLTIDSHFHDPVKKKNFFYNLRNFPEELK